MIPDPMLSGLSGTEVLEPLETDAATRPITVVLPTARVEEIDWIQDPRAASR